MANKQRASLDDVCVLIAEKKAGMDSMGNEIVTTTEREVWCAEISASSAEVFRAGQAGLVSEMVLLLEQDEYSGEEKVRKGRCTATIYRTYIRPDCMVELYAGERLGTYGSTTGSTIR